NDLPALRDELREQANVLVVDALDLLDAELANLLAPKILASTFARATRAAPWPRTTRSRALTVSFCWRASRFRGRCCCSRFFSHDAPQFFNAFQCGPGTLACNPCP